MENNKKGVKNFIKKYGYYAIAFVLVLGITLAIVFSTTPLVDEDGDVDVPPTNTQAVVFSLPVQDGDVTKWYNGEELQWNQSLNQYESHLAIDFVSENPDVYAVLDGIVTNVESTYEYGTIITITHENGFVSKYASLDDQTDVTISDKVKAGSKIGEMTDNANDEVLSGKHLHFELFKDGQKVDPANYLTLENK